MTHLSIMDLTKESHKWTLNVLIQKIFKTSGDGSGGSSTPKTNNWAQSLITNKYQTILFQCPCIASYSMSHILCIGLPIFLKHVKFSQWVCSYLNDVWPDIWTATIASYSLPYIDTDFGISLVCQIIIGSNPVTWTRLCVDIWTANYISKH
jgi:hypothetical protein